MKKLVLFISSFISLICIGQNVNKEGEFKINGSCEPARLIDRWRINIKRITFNSKSKKQRKRESDRPGLIDP